MARLVPDALTLLTALAWSASRNPGQALRAFDEGVDAMALKGFNPALKAADEITVDSIDHALDRFEAATPPIKKTLLLGCASAVMADDRTTAAEAELIRAIAIAIESPVPPFVRPPEPGR